MIRSTIFKKGKEKTINWQIMLPLSQVVTKTLSQSMTKIITKWVKDYKVCCVQQHLLQITTANMGSKKMSLLKVN